MLAFHLQSYPPIPPLHSLLWATPIKGAYGYHLVSMVLPGVPLSLPHPHIHIGAKFFPTYFGTKIGKYNTFFPQTWRSVVSVDMLKACLYTNAYSVFLDWIKFVTGIHIFHITGICPWINMPTTLYIYVTPHFLYIDSMLLLHTSKKQQTTTLTCHTTTIYVPITNIPLNATYAVTSCVYMRQPC